MTFVYTPKDAALDLIGITLVLLPEPVTTPIGLAILCRKRGGGADEHEPTHPLHLYPDYVYKVENIRGREITWQARAILPGQLPLADLNKPEIKIKDREQYILSRTKPEKSAAQRITENLPEGVKVHHELFRPPRYPVSNQQAFIPGETVHHTLRPFPQGAPVINRAQPAANVHHTIENSPGYIIAQSGGANTASGPTIIHHTIQNSPGMQQGNPANIVKPVRIVAHHTLNPTPPIMFRGRLIQQPIAPPPQSKGTIVWKEKKSGTDRPT
jgi:hypothetical protein